jgi:dihydrofolate reductase
VAGINRFGRPETPDYALDTTWARTTVIDGDHLAFVAELKQKPGGDIGVPGSIALTQSLLAGGLVDELRLCVAPVLVLSGRTLFGSGSSRPLRLTRHVATPSGYLLLDYEVVNDAASDPASS